jgi:hypothetical protein
MYVVDSTTGDEVDLSQAVTVQYDPRYDPTPTPEPTLSVPKNQVPQILGLVSGLRSTARDLRICARDHLPESKVEWVDQTPARMLDQAAAQLERLCYHD